MQAPQSGPEVLTVSALTFQIKELVEAGFAFVWVMGEISTCRRAGSGHIYFNLKDAHAVLPSVLWQSAATRLRFQLQDGLQVIVRGRLSVHPPHGKYQLVVDELHPKGLGAQDLALRQLKEKLAKLGYFDPERKKPLPRFVRRLALVTSPTGAAVRDMLEILGRRWPRAEVWIAPVRVQGPTAAEEIARALLLLCRLRGIDVILLGRGGGSADDLSAFNDERVARAIFHCPIPIVSAVGHEIDVTIADLVADHRALTPSEAAELATPDRAELLSGLARLGKRLAELLRLQTASARHRLALLANRRAVKQPLDFIRERERRLDDMQQRLVRVTRQRVSQAKQALAAGAAQLEGLSPLAVLGRGYSLTRKDGHIVRAAGDVRPGDLIETILAEGRLSSRVETAQ